MVLQIYFLPAEWRFTPLITTCEAESANLWKVAMLPNKRIIVRESALKILAELMLAYQHDPKVYFDQVIVGYAVIVET